MTTEGVRGLAEALRQAPDLGGWRAGMDPDDYELLATAALAWFDARLGSGEVVEAVAMALRGTATSAPLTYGGSMLHATAAVEAVRAALREGE